MTISWLPQPGPVMAVNGLVSVWGAGRSVIDEDEHSPAIRDETGNEEKKAQECRGRYRTDIEGWRHTNDTKNGNRGLIERLDTSTQAW